MKLPKGWEIVSLEKVAKIQTGLAKGKKDQKNIVRLPYLRVANVQDGYLDLSEIKEIEVDSSQVNRYLLQNEDLLLTEGGDFDKLGRGGIWHCQINPCLHQNHVFAVRVNRENLIPYFFAQQVSSFYGKAYFLSCAKQTTNLASINSTQLKEFPVLLPPLLEQCKIAEVLGVWDESIDLLEKLIGRVRSRKQGLMQQLLTGKKRFKEFEGSEWKRYHFKDIFRRITRKNTVNNSNILTISGTHGLINQRDFFNKRVAADNLDGYYLIEKGEFAYNKSYSNGYPLGAIKRLDRYDAGVLSTLYICFGLSNSLNSGDFMAHYFESGIFNKEIYGIAQEGARNHGLLNIGVNDFFELFLRIPSLPEQEKIAAVLSAADEEISTLEKQLAAYKQQKLGLMQQLLTGKIRVGMI
jgi:type I restriction enzyme, S subunit